jgi:hypothetical protein
MSAGEAVRLASIALALADEANRRCGGDDPRHTFVALLTAAAIAGHIINRRPDEMHAVLDQVMAVAEAALLRVTETQQ